jgi:quinol monooxygenase YgiN
MSKISIIAKLTAAEGKASELEASLARLITAAEEESGLEIYSAHKDPKNEGVYYFFEMYSDRQALEVHGKGGQMKEAMKAMGSLLGGRPEVSYLEPVVAKGLTF